MNIDPKDFPNLKFVRRPKTFRIKSTFATPFTQPDCPGEFRKIKDIEEARQLGRDAAQRWKKLFGNR